MYLIDSQVKLWRNLLPFSKWYGRGGIGVILSKFEKKHSGRLTRDEVGENLFLMKEFTYIYVFLRGQFTRAIREGLGMRGIAFAEIDTILGPHCSKPWCNHGCVDIKLFVELFVQKYFKLELGLFGFLHRDRRWPDLLKALKTFDISSSACTQSDSGFVQSSLLRSDLEGSLQQLLAMGLVTKGSLQF
jgi:hypothetical protein